MSGRVWKWKKVKMEGTANEPINIWGNPGCKVMLKIIVTEINLILIHASFINLVKYIHFYFSMPTNFNTFIKTFS